MNKINGIHNLICSWVEEKNKWYCDVILTSGQHYFIKINTKYYENKEDKEPNELVRR